jgi:nitrous oxidase accessory protein
VSKNHIKDKIIVFVLIALISLVLIPRIYLSSKEGSVTPDAWASEETQETTIIHFYVPDNYSSIQEAIIAVKPGDVIYVRSGTYIENIIILKPIKLIGENPEHTVISGNNTGDVVSILSDNVEISGFNIQNSGLVYISPGDGGDAGIELSGVSNCTVSKIISHENTLGVFINNSHYNKIENNIVTSNAWDGIYLRYSNHNEIRNNTCSSNGGHAGIYLNPFNRYNIIENNTCSSNLDHGIKIQESSNDNILSNNIASDNGNAGIFLRTSENNIIEGNYCFLNENNPGIILIISNNNTIRDNLCESNDEGISLQHSSNGNLIIQNILMYNRAGGIRILWNNMYNTVFNNTGMWSEAGLNIENSGNTNVSKNTFMYNRRGISILGENSTGVWIWFNNILRNTEHGVHSYDAPFVDARYNWWGDVDGPLIKWVEDTDSMGAEEILGNIQYEPWLTEPVRETLFNQTEITEPEASEREIVQTEPEPEAESEPEPKQRDIPGFLYVSIILGLMIALVFHLRTHS